ncbi:MAG TPA: divalent metal cation transporter [Rickettsiales bacterium]|nr:divalent metal cation transporter [Rickettsiales bacterium]
MGALAQENIKHTDKPASGFKRYLKILGPGFITGASDDDPSGIATYSIAGAQFGTAMLYTSWITWPLLAAVQMMCARIGMVTGEGLTRSLSKKFPKSIILIICCGLFVANTINIAADISGMADAAGLIFKINPAFYMILFGVMIGYAVVKFHYDQIAKILKWLAFSLMAYVLAAILLHPDWADVMRKTFTISPPKTQEGWKTLVAILGTTISPYLFFWQAAQEVECEKKEYGETRPGATAQELSDKRIDITAGALLSNVVMFFIILTTALTLHKQGMTNIQSAKEAAQALQSIAGSYSALLYTVGIITVGFLAIPTLAGSTAYMFADVFYLPQGLDKKFNRAKAFYTIILFSVLCGILLDMMKFNPMQLLFWTAIINGIVAPFMLVGILIISRDRKIMKDQPSSVLNQVVVGIATIAMFLAAISMFVL